MGTTMLQIARKVRQGRRWAISIAVAAVLIEAIGMRIRGFRIGGSVVVRCRHGHLFTTIWIPGVSVKALRFAWWRLQYCPVAQHWSVVIPVRESELTEDQLRAAREHHDIRLP